MTSYKKHYSIVIKGGYGNINFGDDALMLASYNMAKRHFAPDDIAFLCKDLPYIRNIIPNAHVVPLELQTKISSDIVLYGGGTQFYSFLSGRAQLFHNAIRRMKRCLVEPRTLPFSIYHYLRRMASKSICEIGQYNAAIGIGIGPIEASSAEKKFRHFFAKMDFVAVRDTKSFETCEKWGIKNLVLRSDLCYLPGLWNIDSYSNHDNITKGIKRIGIIIRDWPHTREGDNYSKELFNVARHLRCIDKQIQFISFVSNKDIVWQERLDGERETLLSWNPEKQSITAFLRNLSTFDCFITARYHGAVFSSLLGKPTICIGIEPKLELVSSLLSKGARLWRFPFRYEECISAVKDIEANYAGDIDVLRHVVSRQKKIGKRLLDEFDRFVIDCKRESI